MKLNKEQLDEIKNQQSQSSMKSCSELERFIEAIPALDQVLLE